MNRTLTLGAIIFALFWGVVGIWEAKADYTVQVVDLQNKNTKETTRILHIGGDFDNGLSAHVEQALDMYDVDRVVLNSGGGVGWEGYTTGRILSEHKAKTHVANGTVCLSACAIAFIGGEDYTVNGVLGFHKAYLPDGAYDDVHEAFKDGQTSGTYHTYYLLANGFDIGFPLDIDRLTTPSTFIVFEDEKELDKVFARDKEDSVENYLDTSNKNHTIWGSKKLTRYVNKTDNIASKWEVTKTLLKLEGKSEDK